MGGCCCCPSKNTDIAEASPFFHHPASDEHQGSSPHHPAGTALSTVVLVDPSLSTSFPDIYRSPPSPIPYETFIGRPSITTGYKDSNIEMEPSKGMEHELPDELDKSKITATPLEDEEDICPICLEEYDEENPKIIMKCHHYFHLACVLEWMERSTTCALCYQEMVIVPAIGG